MIYDFLEIDPDGILLEKIFDGKLLNFTCRFLEQFQYKKKVALVVSGKFMPQDFAS